MILKQNMKRIIYEGVYFDVSINSFNIIEKVLIKNKVKDIYDLTVNLKVSRFLSCDIHSKLLSFLEIKNHFIYGFKFI